MANLTLTKLQFPTAVSFFGGTGGTNLLTPDPKEIWAVDGTARTLDFDMGAAVTADTFFAGFLAGASSVDLYSATSLGGGLTFLNTLNLGPSSAKRQHAHIKRASVSSRYWRMTFNGAPTAVGIIAIGASVQPAFGHEWGSGRQPIDTGQVTPLRGGGFAVEPGAKKAAWQFSQGDLTDTDLAALWDMTLEIGISSPVLAMEDPDLTGAAMNAALHYGLMASPEVYERQLPNVSRWNFRVEEWV